MNLAYYLAGAYLVFWLIPTFFIIHLYWRQKKLEEILTSCQPKPQSD